MKILNKQIQIEKYMPVLIIGVVFSILAFGLYDSDKRHDAENCIYAVKSLADYEKCESMEGCMFQLADINENTRQIEIHEKCLVEEQEE